MPLTVKKALNYGNSSQYDVNLPAEIVMHHVDGLF